MKFPKCCKLFLITFFSFLYFGAHSQEWWFDSSGIDFNPWQFCTDDEWNAFYFQFEEGDYVTVSCLDPDATNYYANGDFQCDALCHYDYSGLCSSNEELHVFTRIGQASGFGLEITDNLGEVIFPNDIPPNIVGMSFMSPYANVYEYHACINPDECYYLEMDGDVEWGPEGYWEIEGLPNYTYDELPVESEYPVGCTGLSCPNNAGNDLEVVSGCPLPTLEGAAEIGHWSVISGNVELSDPNDPNAEVLEMDFGENQLSWTVDIEGCESISDTMSISYYYFDIEPSDEFYQDIALCEPLTTYPLSAEALPNFGEGLWTVVSGSANISDSSDPNAILVILEPGENCLTWDVTYTFDDGCILYSENDFCITLFEDCLEGCTDNIACNYNPTATEDDGTCEYLTCAGCMIPLACNYDENATIEDDSCEYISCIECVGDVNFDGVFDESDVELIVENFGCIGACPGDVNGDSQVNLQDILFLNIYTALGCD